MDARDRERYARQSQFAPLGEEGQRRLRASHAAIVGCGALGSLQAEALARAGVGRLTLIDRDFVEESNLQRQWLYDEADAAEALPKAVAAARRLRLINSGVEVEARPADVNADTVAALVAGADVILDGTDNFETRFLLNELAVRDGRPWIYGAAVGGGGTVMPIVPGRTACLACLVDPALNDAGPTCETAGILNVASAAVAAFQTAEALKILSGRLEAVSARAVSLDLWGGKPRAVGVERHPDCPVCVRREFPRLAAAGERRPAVLCGRNAVQVQERDRELDLERLRSTLEPLGEVRANEYALRFLAPPYAMTVFRDGRAIIQGVSDVAQARSLYARYIGV
ncbi:MAG: thiazole biosynthesis adenylyltransferase ThiF [Acidobacteria bacterium]|nr:thiazole biosynthesis adenylyltransferase ThiF [Acidobacteriota bacterium]